MLIVVWVVAVVLVVLFVPVVAVGKKFIFIWSC
jgi:hypothetical protein